MNCLPAEREIEREGRASAGMTLHANLARVLLNDAVGDRKSEAGAAGLAFARRSLRSKERIVNALNVFRRDARPGVGHTHADALAVERGYAQRAATRHRVFGV